MNFYIQNTKQRMNTVMIKKLKLIPFFLICALFFVSCADKTVVYKNVTQSDWLLRVIGEEVEVEFNLKEPVVTIRDIERSFLKDKTKDIMRNTWYCRGTYEGNPLENGIVKINIKEYSLDFIDWKVFDENADIQVFDANQIEINDGKFLYDDEEFMIVPNKKEHKKIDKKLTEAKKIISEMNSKDEKDFIKKRTKLEALKASLEELKTTPEWTAFDETDLFVIGEYFERSLNKKTQE